MWDLLAQVADPAALERALNTPAIPFPALVPMTTRLVMAAVLGALVAVVHGISAKLARRDLDRPFMTTLVLLAVVIALVTVVIADNAARAFTLAGSLAIVRFRTTVEDTRDTAFVIFAVVSGMAAGNDYLIAPLLCLPLAILTVIILRPRRTDVVLPEGTLVLRLAAGKPPDPRITELLQVHSRGHRLAGVSTARGGAAYDLTYRVQLTAPEAVLQLVAELSRIDGVQGVEVKDG